MTFNEDLYQPMEQEGDVLLMMGPLLVGVLVATMVLMLMYVMWLYWTASPRDTGATKRLPQLVQLPQRLILARDVRPKIVIVEANSPHESYRILQEYQHITSRADEEAGDAGHVTTFVQPDMMNMERTVKREGGFQNHLLENADLYMTPSLPFNKPE